MLDLSSAKKKKFKVKLPDGRIFSIGVPKKSFYKKLCDLQEKINDSDDVESLYDDVVQIVADILAMNTEKHEITAEQIDADIDLEDMALIFHGYVDYVCEVTKDPN